VVLGERNELSGGAVDAEAEGFARFVMARERALQRTAVLLTGDWALAEDLVQTALAKTWPRWERISGRDDPEFYVLAFGVAGAGAGLDGPGQSPAQDTRCPGVGKPVMSGPVSARRDPGGRPAGFRPAAGACPPRRT
jgi:Sigma-70 region 2